MSYRYTDGLTVSNELLKNESKKKGSSLGGSFMAVVINSGSLFQAGGKQIGHGTKSSRTDNAKRKKNVSTAGRYSSAKRDDSVKSSGVDIRTENGIGISVNRAGTGDKSTYLTEDDGVMLELSEGNEKAENMDDVSDKANKNGIENSEDNENSVLISEASDKESQKSKKEEEYEKFEKQLESLKDMLDRMKETQKNIKKTETKTKKVLNYSYKKVSSSIRSAKSVSQASNAVSSASSNLAALKRKAASGNYDDDEINIAISHAKKMIAVAKKKLANIKQEVMNKKDDDKYISSKKDVVMRISEEKIRVWQQKELNKIEEEIRKQEQKEKLAHRGEENNKMLDADMTYLKEKIEIWKRGGGDLGIMMAQSQGAGIGIDMTQTITDTSKLATEQTMISAEQSEGGQTEVAASINLSV